MAFENLRTRLLYRPLDALMVGSLRPRKRLLEYLRTILSPWSSFHDRVASLAGLIDTLAPGVGKRPGEILFRPGSLPFRSERVELIGSGSGSAVFLLQNGRSRVVLKAYRRTIGKGRRSLIGLAGMYRKKFETVSSWYAGPYEIVAPASFLVLHGPLLGRPAVACLQPYIEGEKRDLFADFEDRELVRLMKEDKGFRNQFSFFARRTLDISASQGLCADLLGRQNVLVTKDRGSLGLKLIDYGILDIHSLKDGSPAACLRIAGLISRLKSLLDVVSPPVEHSVPGSLMD